jgi:hypothetical protein
MSVQPTGLRSAHLCFAQSLLILLVGVAPWPVDWAWARSVLDSARSPELNRAEREINAGGYYEGLIGGDGDGSRGEMAMRLLGKPSDWVRFHAANVSQQLEHDFLLFELKPNLRRTLFNQPFTTNRHGMRDRECTVAKPPGTYRIAVLGSSIDMGWGVGTEVTYVNLLQDWLNVHAARRGLSRRFEVLNFAVAAYSPMQRLEAFRRKAVEFEPDMVLYSATLLDTRLIEIYICDLIQSEVDPHFDFLRAAIAEAGIGGDDLRREPDGKLANKASIKDKLRPRYWDLYDQTLGLLADQCRSLDLPLACLIIPRVGKADAPDLRAEPVARLRGIAAHHAIPLFDLTSTFDQSDPARLEIAAWDDHPNALGHRRLFLALAHALVEDAAFYKTLFPPAAAALADATRPAPVDPKCPRPDSTSDEDR